MAAKRAGAGKSKANSAQASIGIIGGSGLYTMGGLTGARELPVKTPFGEPSDAVVLGTFEGKRVAFLARHGRGHRILPSEINYRANIYAMKLLGVERIISVSAVGSLKEDLRPGEFLVPDQFFDRTKNRAATFFGDGLDDFLSGRKTGRAREILPDKKSCSDVLWRRPGRPCGLCASHVRAIIGCFGRRVRGGSGRGASEGNVHLHRGAPVFHAGRGGGQSAIAVRRHWHDESDRSQAGA